ncbi:MAG: S8 family serine peptidase [Synergistaceae bacterium]|nr:S8 family serine peptidase [Synergistaceae bacterium]
MKIKRILTACIMLLAFASGLYAGEFKPGDVIVVMKPDSSKVSAASLSSVGSDSLKLVSIASEADANVVSSYKNLSKKSNKIFATIHSDTKSPEELAKELLKNPDVIAASPNYIARISALTPDDTSYSEQWGMEYIGAPDAWEYSTGSSNVYVAVIDTGVDWNNPDLTDNVATGLAKSYVSGVSSAFDDNGHGTHVAGIIGAKGDNSIGVTGVNWDVKIIPIKTMNANGAGYVDDIMKGMDYVIDLVEQGYNVAAVNLSLEFYADAAPTYANLTATPLWQSFKTLDNLNSTVMVVAAGNYQAVVGEPTTRNMYDGNGNLVYSPGNYVYPASFRGLNNFVSVTALDTDGSLADFTNTNGTMSAPGVDILSTYLQSSSNMYTDGVSLTTMAGTSMAAPHVAGSVALLAASKPGQTAFQYMCALLGVTGDSASASGNVKTSATSELNLAYAIEYQENHTIDTKGTKWDSEFGTGDNNNDNNDDDDDNNNNNDDKSNSSDPEFTDLDVNDDTVTDTLLDTLDLQSDYDVDPLNINDVSTIERTAEDVADEIPSGETAKLVFPLITPATTKVYVFKVNYSDLLNSGLKAGDPIYVRMTDLTNTSSIVSLNKNTRVSASTTPAKIVDNYGNEITKVPSSSTGGINVAGLMIGNTTYSTVITTTKSGSRNYSGSGGGGGCNGFAMTFAGIMLLCPLFCVSGKKKD